MTVYTYTLISSKTNETLFIFNGTAEAVCKSILDNDKTDILKYSVERTKSRENMKFSYSKD